MYIKNIDLTNQMETIELWKLPVILPLATSTAFTLGLSRSP